MEYPSGKAGGKLEDQPEIYRLLSLLEDRLNQSYPDVTQHLKAQVRNLISLLCLGKSIF